MSLSPVGALPLELQLLLGMSLATALAYVGTPLAIRLADRLDFYDRPAGGYKNHARPTPYLGGMAVLVAFAVVALTLQADERTVPIVVGAVALWGVGTLDDRRPLSPALRLVIEAGAAAVLWALGLGWSLGLGGLVDLGATVLWVCLVINAFNIFDNMDGVATSVAGVTAAALAVVGVTIGDSWLTILAASLSGACLGFLPHNAARPSRIFLGDGGSMPIGFGLAVLPMIGLAGAAPQWQSLGMGLLFVGIPGVDLVMRALARRRAGTPFLDGGRDGLAHWWRRRLGTARAAAVVLGATQAVVSLMAVVAISGGSNATAAAVIAYVLVCALTVAALDVRETDAVAGTAVAVAPTAIRSVPVTVAALVVLAGGLGASAFFGGYYEQSAWVPIGLGLVVVVTMAAIARPVRLAIHGVVAGGALGALAVWALASTLWAESAERATVDANRLLLYGVLLLGVLLLLRRARDAQWLMNALAAVVAGVALFVLYRMLSDPASLFLGGRLGDPLGYVNGQGGFLLMGFWPCLALALHRRSAPVAGVGLAGATLLGCLLLASQSRGVALGVVASVVACLVIVPGRLRVAWAVVAAAAGVVVASPWVLDIYTAGVKGPVPLDVGRDAALATLLVSAAAGVGWGLLTAVAARNGLAVRRTATALLAAGAIAAVGVAAVQQADIRRTVDTQYNAFVHLAVEPASDATATQPRLFSGVGNRYDYWRIAWHVFEAHPFRGVGAGNYAQPYFEQRATTEDIRQPHSLGLQALSELGIVGGLLVLAFAAAVLLGARRSAVLAAGSTSGRMVVVAALGTFVAWLAHTSVDWLHLLPGVTGMALCAAAVLVARPGTVPSSAPTPARSRLRLVPSLVGVALLVVTGVTLTRSALAEHYRSKAEQALAAQPAAAIVNADRALRLDAENVDTYYLKAAALARFGRGQAARGALLEAARREPHQFVTWALLGDLAVRQGNLREAREAYGRASSLNPRDQGLQALAKDPVR